MKLAVLLSFDRLTISLRFMASMKNISVHYDCDMHEASGQTIGYMPVLQVVVYLMFARRRLEVLTHHNPLGYCGGSSGIPIIQMLGTWAF